MLFAWRKENEIRLRNVVRWTVKIQSTVSYLANLATSLNIVFLKIKIWNWFKYNTSDLRRKKKKERSESVKQTNKKNPKRSFTGKKKLSLSLWVKSESTLRLLIFVLYRRSREMKGGESKAQAKSTDERYQRIWDAVCLFPHFGWFELDLSHRLKTRGKKAGKKVKDPNKPKRPPSAFFVFL